MSLNVTIKWYGWEILIEKPWLNLLYMISTSEKFNIYAP